MCALLNSLEGRGANFCKKYIMIILHVLVIIIAHPYLPSQEVQCEGSFGVGGSTTYR